MLEGIIIGLVEFWIFIMVVKGIIVLSKVMFVLRSRNFYFLMGYILFFYMVIIRTIGKNMLVKNQKLYKG